MLFALSLCLGVGLLQERLAALYARPTAALMSATNRAASAEPSRLREDAELFERALAAGLLRLDRDGRITMAPADLPLRRRYARDHPELLTPRGDQPDWLGGVWNDSVRRVHQALYFSASGRYVRQQVEAFNAGQPVTRILRRDKYLFWRDSS